MSRGSQFSRSALPLGKRAHHSMMVLPVPALDLTDGMRGDKRKLLDVNLDILGEESDSKVDKGSKSKEKPGSGYDMTFNY